MSQNDDRIRGEDEDPSRTLDAGQPLYELGSRVGRYKLVSVLGEGGFGVVYLAEQEHPIKRQVALKVIKPGMDTKQVIARFETERQALAMLDHPNIARVFDAGTTGAGRPYFAMEYVKGIPITEYCDKYNLGTEERLRLFIALCHAIQHAHQKGIIHRDVKPSNALVMLHDEKPIPKIIDFGVAKALHQRLTERTLFTEKGEFIGTPEYMSPEQAELTGLDVDTRTDIYSLGVLLYELLTGCTPFDKEELRSKGYAQMQRIICEQEPVKPSTKLTTLGGKLEDTARHRRATAEQLRKSVRGDLDWIVMKCLEKDRTRRYDTANGLAMDLEHHLNNEPVLARPPSRLYRFQKLVRRNKGVFAAIGAVAAVLVLGVIASTWQAILARRAERTATEKSIVAETQRQRAEAGERLARLHLYAADMVLAQQALDQGNLGRVNELLDKYRPAASDLSTPNAQPFPDLRGWEWRYLWGRSRSDELYTLGSHSRVVDFVVFSDDGSLLATASQDLSVKIWDVAARRELASISFQSKPTDLCFVPRSRTVAVAVGKEICFLGGPSGQKTGGISCQDYVGSVAYSRDGSRLAIYEGTTLRILDSLTQRELWRTTVPTGWRVTFSPDSTLLAASSNERTVLLLDAASGQQLASLPGFRASYLGSLVFSPDGELLACASGDSGPKVFVHEVKTRQQLRVVEVQAEGSFIGGVAFSSDGRTMAVSGGPHVITLIDRQTRQVVGRLQGHLHEAWAIAFSPDGKTLASGSKDTTVRVWNADPNSWKQAGSSDLDLPTDMDTGNLSPDGSKLCVLTTNNTFAVWDTLTLRLLAQDSLPDANVIRTAAGGWTSPWAISSDGRRLFTVTPTGQIRVWDTQTREFLSVLEVGAPNVQVLTLSRDEKLLAVAAGDRVVRLWHLSTQMPVMSLPPSPGWPLSMAFSPDSQLLAIGFGGSVEAWQISGPQKLLSEHFHTMGVHRVAISPDNRLLAAAGIDAQVTLWDLQKGTLIKAFHGALNSYNSVAISRNGQRVFASGNPGALSVWATDSLQSVGTFKRHRSGVGRLAILGESDTVVSVGGDMLCLWQAPSFAEIEAAEEKLESKQSP